MSYSLSLNDPQTGAVIRFENPHQLRGGTYAMGGTTAASLNVTYNYSKHLGGIGPEGLRSLNGMTGVDSIPILMRVMLSLKNNVSTDYWEPTEGNMRMALLNLVKLAHAAPQGVWSCD